MKTDITFKQNPNLKEYWKTSDGQAFYREQDARNHAKTLSNKSVEHQVRGIESDNVALDKKVQVKKADDSAEREELVAQYLKLFSKKPNHNMGLDKMRNQIQDKLAELGEVGESESEETDSNLDNQENNQDNGETEN